MTLQPSGSISLKAYVRLPSGIEKMKNRASFIAFDAERVIAPIRTGNGNVLHAANRVRHMRHTRGVSAKHQGHAAIPSVIRRS